MTIAVNISNSQARPLPPSYTTNLYRLNCCEIVRRASIAPLIHHKPLPPVRGGKVVHFFSFSLPPILLSTSLHQSLAWVSILF